MTRCCSSIIKCKNKEKKNKVKKKSKRSVLDHPLYQLQESSTDPKYLWTGRVFTVCKNSLAIFLGITKSHSWMYLKWTSQNLTSFANSLSLSFYPLINMACLLSSYKLFALTLLESRESNAIRSPLITKHMYMYLLRSFTSIGSYKFLELAPLIE